MKSHAIIGLMDGTSLDGLDISYCRYDKGLQGDWSYKLIAYQTLKHPASIAKRMNESKSLSPEELLKLDKDLAEFYSGAVNSFISDNHVDKNELSAIASHGHTVYHQPEKRFTLQIGCGETLAYLTGVKVINDFRQKDVAAGGQGAPLVPIGDKLIFSDQADTFINIGGFTNVTFIRGEVKAFDICPGNLPLNRIANEMNESFDRDGRIASSGHVDTDILSKLNQLPYYDVSPPKSLGTEWLDHEFIPLLSAIKDPSDRMRTCVEHIAQQIGQQLDNSSSDSTLITGGGAFNTFLIERIRANSKSKIIIPSKEIIEYKEAIVFGLLGALYLENSINILSSVTGAPHDSIGGVLHLP